MSNVHKINQDKIVKLEPNGPEPLTYSLHNHLLDALDAFFEEHDVPFHNVIAVLEMIKMNLFLQNTLEFEDELDD